MGVAPRTDTQTEREPTANDLRGYPRELFAFGQEPWGDSLTLSGERRVPGRKLSGLLLMPKGFGRLVSGKGESPLRDRGNESLGQRE